MDDLLVKYAEKFGDNFPIFLVMGMSEEEIDNAIKKSLRTNKTYDPEIIEDVDY